MYDIRGSGRTAWNDARAETVDILAQKRLFVDV